MDLKAIENILFQDIEPELKERGIISILAKDKRVIPMVMDILNEEREQTKDLVSEMNNELSRADAFIQSWIPPNPVLKKGAKESGVTKSWILEQISKFYVNYKDLVKHNYPSNKD